MTKEKKGSGHTSPKVFSEKRLSMKLVMDDEKDADANKTVPRNKVFRDDEE